MSTEQRGKLCAEYLVIDYIDVKRSAGILAHSLAASGYSLAVILGEGRLAACLGSACRTQGLRVFRNPGIVLQAQLSTQSSAAILQTGRGRGAPPAETYDYFLRLVRTGGISASNINAAYITRQDLLSMGKKAGAQDRRRGAAPITGDQDE